MRFLKAFIPGSRRASQDSAPKQRQKPNPGCETLEGRQLLTSGYAPWLLGPNGYSDSLSRGRQFEVSVWTQSGGSAVDFTVKQNGKTVISPSVLVTANSNWVVSTPAVSVDDNGDFAVAYVATNRQTGQTNIDSDVITRNPNNGRFYYTTSSPVALVTDTGAYSDAQPDVVIAPDGSYEVAFVRRQGASSNTIWAAHLPSLNSTSGWAWTSVTTSPLSGMGVKALSWPSLQVVDGNSYRNTDLLVGWTYNNQSPAFGSISRIRNVFKPHS